MATDTKREQRRQAMELAKETSLDTPPKSQGRSWRLIVVLALLAVGIWLLPSIIGNTPLFSLILKQATGDLKGSVTVESVSLGWFSPIVVRGVEVKDADNKPVLNLPAASGDRTLASLLWDYSNLGRFRLESPKLSLVLRDDGSNAEDLLAKYLATEETSEKSTTKVGLAVEIIDGSLSVTDERTKQTWKVEKLAASFEMPEGPEGPIAAKLSADLPDARRPGKLTASAKMAAGAGDAKLGAAGVPLAMFRALAARFSPGTTCDGRLTSDLTASWGGPSGKNTLQADLSTEAFSLITPALQNDQVQLENLHAACFVSWQTDRLTIEKSTLDCDVGSASLASTVRLDQSSGFSPDSLLHQQHDLKGQVDLARLARILPATLRLRQQVEIKSGQVQIAFSSQPEQQGMKWHGQLDAANLTATSSGNQIAWERPMSMAFDAHETSGGPVVDALRCESDFLKVHAAGTSDDLAASLSFNLKQLSDQLGQFVDLGAMQLAGEGWGQLSWKRSAKQEFDADCEIRLQKFQLAMPDQPAWQEADLVALLSAKGQTNMGVETRIDTATLSVKTASDQIDARLVQPVKDLRNGGVWPVHVQAQGQLQNWPGRLAAWLPTKDYRVTGGYAVEADGTASMDSVELRQVRAAAAPLIVASTSLNMNEPRLDLTAAGSWNQKLRRLQIEPGNLTCATAIVQANNIVVAVPEKGPMELAGTLKYQGDVARIRGWFNDPQKPSTWQLAGQLSGTAQVHQAAGVIRGETTNDVTNLAVVDSSGQQFQEPRARLVARGTYNNQNGLIQLEQCELTSDVLAANMAGRVAPVSGTNNAQLEGQLGYDLERLAGLLRPYLGSGVRIAGRNSVPISYRGPFEMAEGQSAASVRWDWANIYGFQVGPGELKAAMANGVLQIAPLDLAVSQGRMHLAPTVRLSPEPMELTMPAGMLAQQIQIDPVLCATMMKYIAPILADVATAEGTFSLALGDPEGKRLPCRIPLSNPANGDLCGQFIVHSVEVGPGPLVRAMAVLLGREVPAKLRKESVVQFQMVQGRVYHQGLELIFPEFTVRTYGSVGVADQSLAIMAEMPVPPKWIENNPAAAQALRGQTIQIPIGGTLSKPQLDQRVLENLSRQFLQKAAENVIEGELNKQFDRLFGPRK